MYCYECGKKCVSEWTGYYNKETGSREVREVCPDECKHGRHLMQEDQELDSGKRWWNLYTGYDVNEKCKRCGKVEQYCLSW